MEAWQMRRSWPKRGWSHPGHFQHIKRAPGIVATTPNVRSSAMQALQATDLLTEPCLLHLFIRNSSRSPSAHAIQPLPPEFLEAAPLAASRKAEETTRFWKARCPRDLSCEKLGRWIRSPP